MRCFVALPLPAALQVLAERLQIGLPVGRPVAPAQLHVTLAFLGDQPDDRLEALHDGLCAIRMAPVLVQITGMGVFGGDKPRLIIADVAPDPGLLALQQAVAGAARQAGIRLERRRFHPHITLARINGRLSAPEMGALHGVMAAHAGAQAQGLVPEFTLYRSDLGPKGARYDSLASYPLG